MANPVDGEPSPFQWNRRFFLAAALGGAALAPAFMQSTAAQTPASRQPVSPAPTPRDWQQPLQYPDPDVVALDNRFRLSVFRHNEASFPAGL